MKQVTRDEKGEEDSKRQIMPTIQRYVANDFYPTIAKVRRMIYIKAKPPLLEEKVGKEL